jgi:hypothetical protein
MSKASSLAVSVGLICAGVALGPTFAAAAASPPDFAPNGSVSWIRIGQGGFKAHRRTSRISELRN